MFCCVETKMRKRRRTAVVSFFWIGDSMRMKRKTMKTMKTMKRRMKMMKMMRRKLKRTKTKAEVQNWRKATTNLGRPRLKLKPKPRKRMMKMTTTRRRKRSIQDYQDSFDDVFVTTVERER
jgi:hypothetical protein